MRGQLPDDLDEGSWPVADALSMLVSFIFIYREYRIHQQKGFLKAGGGIAGMMELEE